MAINILNLPHEILHMILCCLSTTTDIISAQLSCRTLRQIAHESDLVQYILQLAAAGLEDVGHWPSTTSISDRVEMLKRRQRAWVELEWQSATRIEPPAQLSHTYSFQLAGSYLVVLTATGSTHLTTLPSNYQSDAPHPLHWDKIQTYPSADVQLPLAKAEHDLLAIAIMLVTVFS